MPRYRLRENAFFAPDYLLAGTVIEYAGPLGPHFEPLDDEAEAALAQYFKDNPHAAIGPTEELQLQGGEPGARVEVVAPPQSDPVVKVGNLALPGKATPGPSDGGKALEVK